MRIKRAVSGAIVISFLLAVIPGCNNNSVGPGGGENLNGLWSETFEWNSAPGVVVQSSDRPLAADEGVTRTSTLKIQNGRFELKILPPVRVVESTADSVYVTNSDDTLRLGSISVSGDTIEIKVDGSYYVELLSYIYSGDSLAVSPFALARTANEALYPLSSVLWAFSAGKHSGTFHRVR